jgi:membrane protein DedA with SNARE-associated domain
VGDDLHGLSSWIGQYGYPIVFLLVLAESAGLPVPGETAVLTAAVICSRPDSPLRIEWVIVAVVAAAVIGDNLGFWVGERWARPRLRSGKRFLFLTPQALKTVEGYFQHYGTLTVAMARFIAGLRVVAALAAGTSGMVWHRFMLANLVGAVAWGVTMSLLGYFFGQSWEVLHRWMGRGALILAGCAVVLVGLPYLLRRVRKLPPVSWNRLLGARIWEGFVAALLVVICVAMLVLLSEHRGRLSLEDKEVRKWVEARLGTPLDRVAAAASYLGSLPVTAGVALAVFAWLRYSGRPWREQVLVAWAFLGSELVGLALLALIRSRGIEPAQALAWPFGFAGLAPLRAAAVYGVAAQMTWRQYPHQAWPARIVAACAILLTGFSVVWSREQTMTEVFVEYVAGGLVLFVGLWWLEGRGVGLLPGPPQNVTSVAISQAPGAGGASA